MDYTITEIHCIECSKLVKSSDPCLEVSQVKWVNGYQLTESKSIYFCQDCCKDGVSVSSLSNGK